MKNVNVFLISKDKLIAMVDNSEGDKEEIRHIFGISHALEAFDDYKEIKQSRYNTSCSDTKRENLIDHRKLFNYNHSRKHSVREIH